MSATVDQGTQFRRQYLDLKAQYPDALLIFRLGDFYEAFDRDAEIVAETLDVALVGKAFDGGLRVPMAGFPASAAESMLGALIAAGHKLALCERVASGEAVR